MARSTENTAATRPRKSAAEKAQIALDKATKDYDRAVEKEQKATEALETATAEVKRADRYLTFAKANPDLPPTESADAESETQLTTSDA